MTLQAPAVPEFSSHGKWSAEMFCLPARFGEIYAQGVQHTNGMRFTTPCPALLSLGICLTLTGGAIAQTATNQDETAIRNLVQKYVQARNDKDPNATGDLLAPDADQLVSTGEFRRGRDALLKGAMASSRKETGKSSITLESVRFVEPSVAIADGRYQTSIAGTSTERKMWTTLVLKRTDQGWKISAIRNMLPAPPISTAH